MEDNTGDEQLSLSDQLKQAEINKLNSEINKTEKERIKIENEIILLQKDVNAKWWKNEKFWQRFFAIFIGMSIIGFYITLYSNPYVFNK